MQFLIKPSSELSQISSKCLVIPLLDSKTLSPPLQQLDQLLSGELSKLLKSQTLSAKVGEVNWLLQPTPLAAQTVLLIGCGPAKQLANNLGKIFTAIAHAVTQKPFNEITLLPPQGYLAAKNAYRFGRQLVEQFAHATYRFERFKSQPKPALKLNKVTVLLADKALSAQVKDGLAHGQAIAKGLQITKDVANLPPNIANAAYLAEQGQALAKQYPTIQTEIVDEAQMQQLGMQAYLAVSRGSANPALMTVMHYQGADKSKSPIVLVGKGLTFDSGGISIKPSAGMDEMKYDMCGAASVLGVMQAIAELQLPLNVIGVMAGCENMPDGNAYRPGDILTTMSGKTVEVINTDAEGRLVLCDALSYVARFNPHYVIDIATLTGACVIALGHHYSGILANDESLANKLLQAAEQSQDKAWRLPMDEQFQAQVESTVADLVNAAGRDGGTITAGCFLSRFAEDYRWAHLDIAGTAWRSGANKGATGRPVALLVQFLLDQAMA